MLYYFRLGSDGASNKMKCRQNAKKLIYAVLCVSLAVISCGMPVSTLPLESVNKESHIITPTLTAADTPSRNAAESTSRACGAVWVRDGAGVEYQKSAWALKGDTLYLTGEYKTAEDGGKWMKVLDRDGLIGWVNARYLCGGEK